MVKPSNRWCWPCFFIGLGMTLGSTSAIAADFGVGPSWELIATSAFGVVMMLIVAYAKGLERRVSSMESTVVTNHANVSAVRELMLTSYLTQNETEKMIAPLSIQLSEQSRSLRIIEIQVAKVLQKLNVARGQDDGN